MAQIISGVTPQEAGFAYLQGADRGERFFQQQQVLEEQRRQAEFEHMMQIRQAQLEQTREEARSQQLLNERAQMGDAQSIQELELRMQAGQNPDQKMMESVFGTFHRITNPKARAMAAQSIGNVLEERKAQQEKEAAVGAIERAGNDGLVDPKEYKGRLDSGERPQDITKELTDLEAERTVKDMATQKAAKALEQATALVQSAPQSQERLHAEALITQYNNSPTDQAKPGSDADLIFKVQQALLGTAAAYRRRQEEALALRTRRAHSIPAGTRKQIEESLPGGGFGGALTGEAGAPDPYEQPPALKADVKRAKAEKGKRYADLKREKPPVRPPNAKKPKTYTPEEVGKLAVELSGESDDERDLLHRLREYGVQWTPSNIAIARAALGEWSNSAEAQAGADR